MNSSTQSNSPQAKRAGPALRASKREPREATDRDGQQIILVPLANYDEPAKILKADFDKLREMGVSDQWTYNKAGVSRQRYVRTRAPKELRPLSTVARLIVGAGPGIIVNYRDGDTLNLRRDNLKTRRTLSKEERAEKRAKANAEWARRYGDTTGPRRGNDGAATG